MRNGSRNHPQYDRPFKVHVNPWYTKSSINLRPMESVLQLVRRGYVELGLVRISRSGLRLVWLIYGWFSPFMVGVVDVLLVWLV